MEYTWTEMFYQETGAAKRLEILRQLCWHFGRNIRTGNTF